MINALNVASLRGVDVRIVLPEVNNIPPVAWAATAQLPLMLERGCRFFLSPGPVRSLKTADRGRSLVPGWRSIG